MGVTNSGYSGANHGFVRTGGGIRSSDLKPVSMDNAHDFGRTTSNSLIDNGTFRSRTHILVNPIESDLSTYNNSCDISNTQRSEERAGKFTQHCSYFTIAIHM